MSGQDINAATQAVAAALKADDGDAAVLAIHAAFTAGLDGDLFGRKIAKTAAQRGSRKTALACVEAALVHVPDHIELRLGQVDLLRRLGMLDKAQTVLEQLEGESGRPAYWQRRLALQLGADRTRDAAGDAEKGRQMAPDGPSLRHGEIRALIAEEEYDAAANKLKAALAIFPEHAGLNIQDALLRRHTQGARSALPRARAVVAEFPGSMQAQLGLADCLRAAGQRGEAIDCLRKTADRFDADPLPLIRLVRAYLELERRDEALAAAEAARALDKGALNVELAYVDVLIRIGREDDAITTLEALVAGNQITPPVLVKLINALSDKSDIAKATHYAELGLEKFPGSPQLLECLAYLAAAPGKSGKDAGLPAGLATDLPRKRRHSLTARLALEALDMDQALAEARTIPMHLRDASNVNLIARILIGANRYPLAMRYLRFGLGYWGADPRLVSLFSQSSNRIGQSGAAFDYLKTLGMTDLRRSPAALSNLMLLVAAAGRPVFAARLFQQCLRLGSFPAQNAWSMLLRCLVASGRIDLLQHMLDAREASGLWAQPHLQKTYHGQLLTEVRIAATLDEEGPMRSVPAGNRKGHIRLMADFPDSNVSAMRYVHHWRSHVAPDTPPKAGSSPVPREVAQYWDKPEPPEAINAMIDTWRGADGLTHSLFNRRSAEQYLREAHGDECARAFRLARNPAEESDFFRLCLLADRGGIYADADDMLTGDIGELLPGGAGLILMLEPPMSVVANNFIAAAPGHPALQLAAGMAKHALLSRASETTWSKTGPGLLTRALAMDLATRCQDDAPVDLTLVTMADVIRVIRFHNPAEHKRAENDWRGRSSGGLTDEISALLNSR